MPGSASGLSRTWVGGAEEFALGSGRCVVGLVFQVAQTKREQERRGQQAKRLVSICVQQKRKDRHEQQQRGDDDLQPQRVDGCRHSFMMNQSPAAGMVSWK